MKYFISLNALQADQATGAKVITINQAGTYRIHLTVSMTARSVRHELQVLKKSSGGTTCSSIMYMDAKDPVRLAIIKIYFVTIIVEHHRNINSFRSENSELRSDSDSCSC